MNEQPANIVREAKEIHQKLKETLKNKELSEKEVKDADFQRKNLRRRYLNLLLVHPYAKESKDVENHLWMQTSYAFISSYKQRILNLDRIIQSKQKQPPQQNQRPNNVPIVQHRKILAQFRQFLAEEEKFWSELVRRLRRSFGLDEATPALLALGIISATDDGLAGDPEHGAPQNGRNHFQFPPEDPSHPFTPTTAEQKALWLSVLSKALICLGDIARYRELYNESGGRPRAGQEEPGTSRRSRNRRGGHASEEPIPRPRNYEKAQHCYEQARLLVPDDGNPSHQLAIIATYKKDSLLSLTHYYRALCVRTPYDTASENLGSVLGKALEAWKTRSRRERDRHDSLPPRAQIEVFKENTVVLHALWKVGMEKGVARMKAMSRQHNKVVFEAFVNLVSQRYLLADMITNVIVLSQGALWKHRMVRPHTPAQSRRPELPPPPEGTSIIIEWHILEHLLDLHRGLLEVGLEELEVPPPRDAPDGDLAQRITATFRRCLPALRVASKWLRANFKYVMQDHEFDAYQELKRTTDDAKVTRNSMYQFSRFSKNTQRFWKAYALFVSKLARTFTLSKLPPLTVVHDEDIDMRGFLPLKNLMGVLDPEVTVSGNHPQEDTHPNDWQLMKIADLIRDANEITKLEGTPIKFFDGPHYTFMEELVEPQQGTQAVPNESVVPPPQQQHLLASIRDTSLGSRIQSDADDDNMTEATSKTDDDVLRDAFQFLNATSKPEDEDEDEDEIVWDPRAPVSPVIQSSLPSPTAHATPVTRVTPLLKSPIKHSPTHSKTMSPFMSPGTSLAVAPTTAQDLLNDVMNGRSSFQLESPAPVPALLFGSDLSQSHLPGQNIWSSSHHEQALRFTSQPNLNQTYPTNPQGQSTAPLEMSQSIWSSSYPSATQSTQNSQSHIIGAMPAATYPPISPTHGSHHRLPSASSLRSPSFPNLFSQHDPFSYSFPAGQQLPQGHRPDSSGFSLNNNPAYTGGSQLPLSHAGSGMFYQSTPIQGYHSHNPSFHDPRLAQQHFPHAQPSSQLWGNVG